MRAIGYRLVVLCSFCAIGKSPAADSPAIKTSETDKPPVVMEAFKVAAAFIPRLSFGLSLDVWRNNDTQKVMAIYVRGVKFGSSAAKNGLCARARIYSIDRRPVEDFVASFFKGTDLYQKFVERHEGDRVVLEIGIPGEGPVKFVTLEASHGRNIPGFTEIQGE